jgi:hypothetical protein
MMGYGITLIGLIFYALGVGATRFPVSGLASPLASPRRGFAMAVPQRTTQRRSRRRDGSL